MQLGVGKVSALEIALGEVCALEHRALQLGLGKVSAAQVYSRQITGRKVCALELGLGNLVNNILYVSLLEVMLLQAADLHASSCAYGKQYHFK
jgi:hypothetical protein